MNYKIENASLKDLDTICLLFEKAIHFQKSNGYIGWQNYDKEFINTDIQNGLSYKLIKGTEIIGIFSICFNDALIWREKDKQDAIYLHRIVLNQRYKGEKIFSQILHWTKDQADERQLKYIRMDTWADNEKIISYYKSYGFQFIENYITPDIKNLPIQHRNLNVALLEFNLQTTETSHKLNKVNINHELSAIDKYWNQKIIGESNGQLIKLANGIGEIHWHKHDDQDELFIL